MMRLRVNDIDTDKVIEGLELSIKHFEAKAREFDHRECSRMESDFDACVCADPVERERLELAREHFQSLAENQQVLLGQLRAVFRAGPSRVSFDSWR